jgi:hypothetical protein
MREEQEEDREERRNHLSQKEGKERDDTIQFK